MRPFTLAELLGAMQSLERISRYRISHADHYSTPLLFMVAVIFVAVLVSVLMVALYGQPTDIDGAVLSTYILNGCVSASLLGYYLTRRPVSCATLLWYFVFLFMFLVPFVQYLTSNWKWAPNSEYFDVETVVYSNLLVTLTYGIALITYKLAYYRTRSSEDRDRVGYSYSMAGGSAVLVVIALLLYLYIDVFGLAGLVSKAYRREVFLGGEAVVSIASIGNFVIRPACIFLALAMWLLPVRGSERQSVFAPLVLVSTAVVAIVVSLPTGTGRNYVLAIALVLLGIGGFRESTTRIFMLVLLVGGIYFSSLLDQARFGVTEPGELVEFDSDYFFVGHFNSYETILHNVEWVERDGISGGSELLGTALFWVPRFIWPGKPESPSYVFSGQYLGSVFGTSEGNVGVSTLGTFYHSLGMAGTIVFGVIIGVLGGTIDGNWKRVARPWDRLRGKARRGFPAITLFPFLAVAYLILLRGQVWVGVQMFVGYIMAYLLVCTLAIRVGKDRDSRAVPTARSLRFR